MICLIALLFPNFSNRAFGFACGVIVAVVFVRVRGQHSSLNYPFYFLSSGLILLCLEIFILNFLPSGWFVLSFSFGLIVLGSALLPIPNLKFVRLLGSSSYGIYLVQALTIPFSYSILDYLFGWEKNANYFFWIVLAMTVVVGVLFEKIFIYPTELALTRLVKTPPPQ